MLHRTGGIKYGERAHNFTLESVVGSSVIQVVTEAGDQ